MKRLLSEVAFSPFRGLASPTKDPSKILVSSLNSSMTSSIEYISTGGNRNSAAADWSASGVLAFGSDPNIALWRPLNEHNSGIFALLTGHNAKVTAVRFLAPTSRTENEAVVSGDADGCLRTWYRRVSDDLETWSPAGQVQAHTGAVNCLAFLADNKVALFASGGSDATIKIWRSQPDVITLTTTIDTKPRYIPLSLTFNTFPDGNAAFITAGGTRHDIQVYAVEGIPARSDEGVQQEPSWKHCAALSGHEGWVRSLAMIKQEDGSYVLASASADKYVRLWKFIAGTNVTTKAVTDAAETGVYQTTLTPKLQTVASASLTYTITFEALLLGQEDWVYSAAWTSASGRQQLLTASADGTLTVWEPDPASGVWYSASRLGEISGQKGATTATGSSGGFWNALWSPDGKALTCLGRTGSWRLWQYDDDSQYWSQRPAVSGHISSVQDMTWSPDGSYLLSTGSDQTTRLHAEWKRGKKRTWHEFARPQIHGYDLNCVSSTSSTQFASGADEKLLRVFDEPKVVAGMLERLSGIRISDDEDLPDVAAIPVLGLSNKAEGSDDAPTAAEGADISTNGIDANSGNVLEPPNEDMLSRHTLFPEHEKLYGHGYEISTCTASSGHNLLATACKASSLDHAVIRLYDTVTWREVKPPLSAHTLTVTRLAFSQYPESYLLSVGRDRQWAVFECDDDTKEWFLLQSNPKAHARMILDCAWSPVGGFKFFATAGRDKTIKIWSADTPNSSAEQSFVLVCDIRRMAAVTAVDFTCDFEEKYAILAAGEEDGKVSLHVFDIHDTTKVVNSVELLADLCPSKTVNKLAWRTDSMRHACGEGNVQLAIASMDSSVRILSIPLHDVLGYNSSSSPSAIEHTNGDA